jgi:hypothetical protein
MPPKFFYVFISCFGTEGRIGTESPVSATATWPTKGWPSTVSSQVVGFASSS